jgi:hypothetical protein
VGLQVASHANLFCEGEPHHGHARIDEKAGDRVDDAILGQGEEANGVAHTMAVAAAVTSKVAPKAIHHALRPRRWRPRDFQPSLQ